MIDWESLRDTAGVLSLLRVAEQLELDMWQCSAGTRIDRSRLEQPFASVRAWQELKLLRNIQNLMPELAGLALLTLPYYNIKSLGILGLGMRSCETVGRAFRFAEDYQSFGLYFSRIKFQKEGEFSSFTINAQEIPKDCQKFCIERGLASIIYYIRELTDSHFVPNRVEMSMPAPQEPNDYAKFFGVPLLYESKLNRLVFDSSLITARLLTANRKTRLLCEYFCNNVRIDQTRKTNLDYKIRDLLLQRDFKISAEEIANELGMSSRSLRRYFSGLGKTIRQLTIETKMTYAQIMLEDGHSIGDVAQKTGYSEPASFARSFKLQTGHTPGEYTRKICVKLN